MSGFLLLLVIVVAVFLVLWGLSWALANLNAKAEGWPGFLQVIVGHGSAFVILCIKLCVIAAFILVIMGIGMAWVNYASGR